MLPQLPASLQTSAPPALPRAGHGLESQETAQGQHSRGGDRGKRGTCPALHRGIAAVSWCCSWGRGANQVLDFWQLSEKNPQNLNIKMQSFSSERDGGDRAGFAPIQGPPLWRRMGHLGAVLSTAPKALPPAQHSRAGLSLCRATFAACERLQSWGRLL